MQNVFPREAMQSVFPRQIKVEVACFFFLSTLFLQVLKYVLHCILYILNYRVQGTSSGLLQNFKRGGSMAALFEFSFRI
jgi:hypothetical protein